MRTIVGADDTVKCLPRLTVKDELGDWQDITNRVYSISLNDNLEADSASVTFQIRNHPDIWINGPLNQNLDPLDENSSYYVNGAPLLGRYHEVKLEISKDDGAHYYEVFRGYAGPGSVTVSTYVEKDDTITFVPCDLSFPYKAFHFYDSLIYKDADAVSIMSQIFADHGFNQTVTAIDNPNRHIQEVTTGQTNIWAAQKAMIEATGYIYRIKWYDGAFRPCVYNPGRDRTTADAVFLGTFSYRKLDISEADVRTRVIVSYRNRDTGNIEHAQAEDEIARDQYGIPDGSGRKLHNTMWYAAQGTGHYYSLIDTPAEASTLAGYILHDLKKPAPDIEIKIPRIRPDIEIHDLLSFVGNDYTVLVGVTGITWSWSVDNPIGETIIEGTTDRVIGEFRLWLTRDAHSQDVQQDLTLAFLQGDGKRPARPATPHCISYWGRDSETGSDTPVTVCTVRPNKEWDLAGYLWHWQIEGEEETETRITQKPRIVVKGLPVGRKVRFWVQAFDWTAEGLQ